MHVSVLCPPLLNRNTLSAHINALTREIEASQSDIEDQSLCNQITGNNHNKFDKTLSTRGPLTSFSPQRFQIFITQFLRIFKVKNELLCFTFTFTDYMGRGLCQLSLETYIF